MTARTDLVFRYLPEQPCQTTGSSGPIEGRKMCNRDLDEPAPRGDIVGLVLEVASCRAIERRRRRIENAEDVDAPGLRGEDQWIKIVQRVHAGVLLNSVPVEIHPNPF